MDTEEEEKRKKRLVEKARKQLAEGTWPQVMAVFGYSNPNASQTTKEEYLRLKVVYEQAACPNIVQFLELLYFTEKEHRSTMSFNLSMRRRLVPGEVLEPTLDNFVSFLSCPDVLVGTRGGSKGAAAWLKNFSEAMPNLAPESVQVMDKIFGEALEFLRGPSRTTTVDEMLKSAVLGEGEILEPPKVSKH